ncbi:radical SAM protein [candidate division NPL-UPA2 bacterium]|nr:radical SAM protein [candidate division NPL-UPA2 bacterium]
MSRKAKVQFGKKEREYEVIEEPRPHILVSSSKELHGWWPGKRECTAERLLINPYNGCSLNCHFCYAHALPGYFQLFKEEGVVTVCKDFDQVVADELDSISVASCGYLSPVTDPFQPLNERYKLSEKIIKEFISRNIPIEFITKEVIPDEAIQMIKGSEHSFGQVSILTLNDEIRSLFMSEGASTEELFVNLKRLSEAGIYCVCRLDPILPYITDKRKDLEALISRAIDSGARHIVASCLDIPLSIYGDVKDLIRNFGAGLLSDYSQLYNEIIDGSYHASIYYRKGLFDLLRNICERKAVTFALCMEYELIDGESVGLNREFMNSTNCEGINIPIYIRDGKEFKAAADCNGACLDCREAKCGVEELAMGREGSKKAWKLADYRRWSKEIKEMHLPEMKLMPCVEP